jgi:hypothetical protein
MKRKVRIKSLPKGYHMMPDGTVMKDSAHMAEGGSVNKNLSPIPRGMANLEAEKGEVAMTDLGKTGQMGLYEIGGERHSNGGTPLNLDPGSFIYSDTRKMKIKDPQFLAKYGKSTPTTPAKLVKPFLKMNDFTNTLYDQNADPIQKRTAQTMIDNYKDKAGEIAFYQEAMKGFPQGIPAVAADYAEGIMGAPMAAYGGYIPKAQDGITLYPGGKTKAGTVTPTGKENIFDRDIDYLSQWESAIPGVTNLSNKQAQEKIYDYMLQNEPDVVRNMWGTYGLTAKGLKDPSLKSKYEKGQIDPKSLSDEDLKNLRSAYADSYFGARQLDPIYQAPAAEQPVEKAATPVQKAAVSDAPSFTPATPTRTFPFQQDINNLDMARRNRLSERRYSSYAPRIPYALADAVYLDDTRPQQQIAGRAKGSMDALGAFAGPSRQLSSASLISGQAAEQAANVAANLGNVNAQIANQLEQSNAQMKYRADIDNASLAKRLYDENITMLDTFDEKMRGYRTTENVLKNTLETNRAKAQLLNQLYPDFQINTMPGMYGEITANPEVLRAMQDPEKFKQQQSDQRQSVINRITQEAFTFHPVKVGSDGKDENAAFRAAYINEQMSKNLQNAQQSVDPLRQYLSNAYMPSFGFMSPE